MHYRKSIKSYVKPDTAYFSVADIARIVCYLTRVTQKQGKENFSFKNVNIPGKTKGDLSL